MEEQADELIRVQILINGNIAYDQEITIKRRLDVEVIADKSNESKQGVRFFRNVFSVKTVEHCFKLLPVNW